MKVVAGCDGGGTKCHVQIAICDDNGIPTHTAEAITGTANVKSNPVLALQNIQRATSDALRSLALATTQQLDMIVAGLAGAGDSAAQSHWQQQLLKHLPTQQAIVVPDAEVLFAAAGIKRAAVATVIGTGSIAWARDDAGTITRAGGLGPTIGDEGSAHWISTQAIQHATSDGTPFGDLTLVVLNHFTATRGDELQTKIQSLQPGEIAQFAPKVFSLAKQHPVATQITQNAAQHIANLIQQSTRTISTSKNNQLDWICAGGIATHQPSFLHNVRSLCETESVYLTQPHLVQNPVHGALSLAIERFFPR